MGDVLRASWLITSVPWLVVVVLLFTDVPGRLARRFFPARDEANVRLAIQVALALAAGVCVAILDRKSQSLGIMIVVGVGVMVFGMLFEWSSRKMEVAREDGTWTKQLETRHSLSLLVGYVVFMAVFIGFFQLL